MWLYPPEWRRRYGAEFAALLAQQPLTPAEFLDVLRGALDAHAMARQQHPARMAPASAGGKAGSRHEARKERDMKRGRAVYGCSFCGKSQQAVRRLIAGPGGVYICDGCVRLCNEIIAHDGPDAPLQRGDGTPRTRPCRTTPWWQRLLGRGRHIVHRSRRPVMYSRP
jgi:hypothetical protein